MDIDKRDVAQEIALADGRSIILLDRLAKQNIYGAVACARNIFLLNITRQVIWQVRTAFDAEGAPFTKLSFDGVALKAYRWDGGYYVIDLRDGVAVPASLAK